MGEGTRAPTRRSVTTPSATRRLADSPLLILLALLIFAAAAPAQTRPATGAAIEGQSIVRTRSAANTTSDNGIPWQRIVVATVVVLGLIIALRYVAGWLMPSTRSGGGGRGVRVLSRTSIAPRQQVLLLHVGRRVVVVGDSAGTLSSLATITEPDEVAELLGQAATAPITGRFGSVFGRAQQPFDDSPESMTAADDPDVVAETDPAVAEAQDEIAGLRERMKRLSKTMGK